MRRIDHEMMNGIAERAERIRDYVPAEEFDSTTALIIAKEELLPFANPEANLPGGTDGN